MSSIASWYIIQKKMLLISCNCACGLHTEARLLLGQVDGTPYIFLLILLHVEARVTSRVFSFRPWQVSSSLAYSNPYCTL